MPAPGLHLEGISYMGVRWSGLKKQGEEAGEGSQKGAAKVGYKVEPAEVVAGLLAVAGFFGYAYGQVGYLHVEGVLNCLSLGRRMPPAQN